MQLWYSSKFDKFITTISCGSYYFLSEDGYRYNGKIYNLFDIQQMEYESIGIL